MITFQDWSNLYGIGLIFPGALWRYRSTFVGLENRANNLTSFHYLQLPTGI
jgi:hypothetical protein